MPVKIGNTSSNRESTAWFTIFLLVGKIDPIIILSIRMLFLVLFETANVQILSVPFAAEHAFEIVPYLAIAVDALVLTLAALALVGAFQYVTILAVHEALHDLLVFLLQRKLVLVLEIVIHTFLQKKQNSSEFCFK